MSAAEIRKVLKALELGPRDVLRAREAKQEGIDDETSDKALIEHMARVPTLLQRPILVKGNRAVLGRPVENIAEFLGLD